MKYALLIYHDEQANMAMSEAEQTELMNAHWAYFHAGVEAGVVIPGGPALYPTSMATSVRVRDGQTLTTDGPFAETKEQLGGLYIIQADDLDQAIEWASRLPEATHGTIEIRPIVVFD